MSKTYLHNIETSFLKHQKLFSQVSPIRCRTLTCGKRNRSGFWFRTSKTIKRQSGTTECTNQSQQPQVNASYSQSGHISLWKHSQWGRQLGSNRTLFPAGLAAPFCRSPCSEIARLKPRAWPLMEPRCHLQISPFSMSWMCCTMRLIATEERNVKENFTLRKIPGGSIFILNLNRLTHVVHSPWNDDVNIFLCLKEKQSSHQ